MSKFTLFGLGLALFMFSKRQQSMLFNLFVLRAFGGFGGLFATALYDSVLFSLAVFLAS